MAKEVTRADRPRAHATPQPWRSDVVGSLLRPRYLQDAKRRRDEGALSDSDYKRVEDRAVDGALALQEGVGLEVVSDGEFRRYAFFGHLIDNVEGFDKFGGWAIPFHDDAGHEIVFSRPVVVARLRRLRPLAAEEFVYLRARARATPKVTLLSAQQAAAYYDPDKSGGAYPTIEAYLADVVDILRAEVDALIRLGCTYIQLDAPQYAALLDPQMREGYRRRGNDPDKLLDRCIELDNAVIGNHPGVVFAIHLCRGNNQSKYYASGGYEPVAQVFERTRFGRFLLEYDDERSGDFSPLRHLPEDRTVVLGLVTTKRPELESKGLVKRRIEEASRFVPMERLALSPQCGFASTEEGNLVTLADQEAKLQLVAELAREVWGG